MDGEDTNSPKGMKIPGGLTSTPAHTSKIPLITEIELSDDDEEEEGIEVIEDSDNDDGMN